MSSHAHCLDGSFVARAAGAGLVICFAAACGVPAPGDGGADVPLHDAADARVSIDAPTLDAPDAVSLDADMDAATGDATAPADASTDAVSGDGAAGDGAWDPRSGRPPARKGIWIWYFDYVGYTAAQVAQRCQALGIGYVLIKSGQDGSYWSTRYNAATLREFTSRGIEVFAWPYVTPRNVSGSIDAIAQAAAVPGTRGIILDVEIEFEGSYATQAQQLCEGIRARVPGVFLGYTSFGWVGYHGTFPFHTFDRYCGDVFMPQVYWTDRGVSWTFGYQQAVDQIRAAGLRAPVWMIQSNDNTPAGAAPSTADLNAFFDRAGPFTSLWEWPAAGMNSKVTQLGSLHWAN